MHVDWHAHLTEGTRIVLATPAPVSHRTAEENLGLGYLAAVLRQSGREVEIIDGWLEGLSAEELAVRISARPVSWLGFACYRSNMQRAMESVADLREGGAEMPIVAGGFGPTFFPGDFLEAGVDIVVRGEAEQTVLELARHFESGEPALAEIPGLTYLTDGEETNTGPPLQIDDLDTIPMPERDTIDLAISRRSAIHIVTARGCGAHCLFCSIVSFARLSQGPNWRQRSIARVVDELELLTARGARAFKVIDDSLIEPPRDAAWCSELADEIESRGLKVRMRGSVRADRVDDDVLRELSRAGFFAFSCGIENFSDSALWRMRKTATAQMNCEALDLFAKHGLLIQAGHILFDHGTTVPELRENLDGMRRYDWTVSKGIFTEMFAAEGTPFTRLLRKQGHLRDTQGLENYDYEVADSTARVVYGSLKRWHLAHMELYDQAIDAISAPKALDEDEVPIFHSIAVDLRRRDLNIFESLLEAAEAGASEDEALRLVDDLIEDEAPWYEEMQSRVERAYATSGLVYDADPNPFVV